MPLDPPISTFYLFFLQSELLVERASDSRSSRAIIDRCLIVLNCATSSGVFASCGAKIRMDIRRDIMRRVIVVISTLNWRKEQVDDETSSEAYLETVAPICQSLARTVKTARQQHRNKVKGIMRAAACAFGNQRPRQIRAMINKREFKNLVIAEYR